MIEPQKEMTEKQLKRAFIRLFSGNQMHSSVILFKLYKELARKMDKTKEAKR